MNNLHHADKKKYEILTQQIDDEKKKLKIDGPENRLAAEEHIALLKEERKQILL